MLVPGTDYQGSNSSYGDTSKEHWLHFSFYYSNYIILVNTVIFYENHDLIKWPMLFYYGSHCDNTFHILRFWFGLM